MHYMIKIAYSNMRKVYLTFLNKYILNESEVDNMVWEYKVIKAETIMKSGESENFLNELDKLGVDGWELVGIFEKPQTGIGWIPKTEEPLAIFKRQKM